MLDEKKLHKVLNKDFALSLLELAEIANDNEGDTVNFVLYEMNGIRMDVCISFGYTRVDKEEN